MLISAEGSEQTMMSEPSAIARGPDSKTAPRSANGDIAWKLASNTATSKPQASRRLAIAPPMIPVPITPTLSAMHFTHTVVRMHIVSYKSDPVKDFPQGEPRAALTSDRSAALYRGTE